MPYTMKDYQGNQGRPVPAREVELPTWAELQSKAAECVSLAEAAADPDDKDRLFARAAVYAAMAQSEAIVYASRAAARRADRP